MKIFVSGSLRNVEKYPEVCEIFVEKLAEILMQRGHILLTGCSGSLDKKIAESAASFFDNEDDSKGRIISYLVEDQEGDPAHNVGTIKTSKLKNWNMEEENARLPEQISEADVTIFIAGSNGTFKGANIATLAHKPIVGIGMFGGAGKKINTREEEGFLKRYRQLIEPFSYDDLNQIVTNDVEKLAVKVIKICEHLMRSKHVFCIMSFDKNYDEVFEIYEDVCKKNELIADRTDKNLDSTSITLKIFEGIEKSDFVIADVSGLSPNVFFEIGYARALKKDVIITAENGTKIPFDIYDLPRINYDPDDLENEIKPILDASIKHQLKKFNN